MTPLQQPLVEVHLHGPIAERFGAVHAFAIHTPREAVAALDANYPGFAAAFAEHDRWAIVADGDQRGGDEAAIGPVRESLHFYPVAEGNAFVGAMLIGALIPGISTTAATIIGGVLFAGIAIGLSFLIKPKRPAAAAEEAAEKPAVESYAFTGPENVTAQGVAVPLIYGRVFAGSVVVSAGLSVSDELVPE